MRDQLIAKKYGLAVVNKNQKVIELHEKPERPPSTFACIGVYFFPQASLPLIDLYLNQGERGDQPGYLIQWFVKRGQVWAYFFDGVWYDIGDHASYQRANEEFKRTSRTPTIAVKESKAHYET